MCGVAHEAKRHEDEAEARNQVGKVNYQSRRFKDAITAYEHALSCLGDRDAQLIRGRVLRSWGCVAFESGAYAEAEARWQEALTLLEATVPLEAADVLNNLAVLATVRGKIDEAWALYERVLALDSVGPLTPQKVLTYYNMGMLRTDEGRWDEALELYDRSLEMCRKTRYLFHQPTIELNRAEALLQKEDFVGARGACSRALRGYRRLGDTLGIADGLRIYGMLCRIEGNWNDGKAYLEKSIEINRQFGESISLGEALYELGILQREQGELAFALDSLREAESIFEKVEATLDLSRVRTTIAELQSA